MKKMWPSLSLKHRRRWFFIIYPRDFVNDFVQFLLIFCVFWPYKHALWLNTVVLIEGGFPSMSGGFITWGAGVLVTILIQYKTPKKTPILFSFGGKAVIMRKWKLKQRKSKRKEWEKKEGKRGKDKKNRSRHKSVYTTLALYQINDPRSFNHRELSSLTTDQPSKIQPTTNGPP